MQHNLDIDFVVRLREELQNLLLNLVTALLDYEKTD